mmetsp:Transcript_8221/g.14956  ORF Transcript_8221/g.14956 Transcript_8221/m.14956 type:complete len:219 (-) Transcript_8221:781-1437(-)
MATEGLAASERLRVPQPGGVVHTATDQEVAGVVEGAVPDGLGVIRKGVRAVGPLEVPELDRGVATSGDEVGSRGVEIDPADPILVPLSAHDGVSVGDGPDLPRFVVTDGGEHGLPGVERHSGHAIEVGPEGLLELERLHSGGIEVEVGVGVHGLVVGRELAVASLSRLLELGAGAGGLDLSLHEGLDLGLDLLNPRLHAVPLEPHEHLLLHGDLVLGL